MLQPKYPYEPYIEIQAKRKQEEIMGKFIELLNDNNSGVRTATTRVEALTNNIITETNKEYIPNLLEGIEAWHENICSALFEFAKLDPFNRLVGIPRGSISGSINSIITSPKNPFDRAILLLAAIEKDIEDISSACASYCASYNNGEITKKQLETKTTHRFQDIKYMLDNDDLEIKLGIVAPNKDEDENKSEADANNSDEDGNIKKDENKNENVNNRERGKSLFQYIKDALSYALNRIKAFGCLLIKPRTEEVRQSLLTDNDNTYAPQTSQPIPSAPELPSTSGMNGGYNPINPSDPIPSSDNDKNGKKEETRLLEQSFSLNGYSGYRQ